MPIQLKLPPGHVTAYLLPGGSAGIRILHTYVTFSGNIRNDNQSYAVVVQRKSCARCVHVNNLRYVYPVRFFPKKGFFFIARRAIGKLYQKMEGKH